MATTKNLYGGYPADDEGGRIHGLYENLASARATVHTDCFNNLAALYGKSFHYWNPAKSRFMDYLVKAHPDRAYRSVNKIRNIMEARDAFITGDNPTIYISTKNEETIGRQRASIAQRVARAHWDEHDMWGKFIDVREWCKSCGNAFMQIYYDPAAGNLIQDPETGEEVFEGLVKCCPRSSFETFWDPLARYWDEVRYVLLVSVKSREEVEGYKFKIDWDRVERDSHRTAPVAQHEQYLQLLDPEMTGSTAGDFDEEGQSRRVLVIEYYEKPSLAHPRGRYLVVIGRQVVKETELEVGMIPIVPFDDLKVAGIILSQTPISDMRSSQEDLNTYYSRCLERAQMADILGLPTIGNWPKDKERQFAGKPIVVVEIGPAHQASPVFIQGGIVRQDYIMLMRACVEDMENAAGVSSIASRQKPGYQMSGRMGYIVTDANKAILSKISYRFQKSCEKTMRLVMTYINKFYTNERTATYIGEADRREVVRYKGEDIGTDWTLTIRLGNSLLDDPIMRGQMTLQLMSSPVIAQQVISNPIALKKVTESVNPELAEKWFVSEQDTGVAEDENFEISRGGTPDVMPWHNDDVHEREHKRQLDSDEYLNWNETAQQYLVWHYRRHGEQKQAKFAQMAHQMAMLNMGQGGGGGAATRPGQAMKGSPGVAAQQTPSQSIDATLEQATQAEWPGAPKPGGGGE